MNTIAQAIMKRKSIRKYNQSPITSEDMNKIKNVIKDVKSLYNDIPVDIQIVEDGAKLHGKGFIGGYGSVNAPHYLVVTSKVKDGHLENAGFAAEQIVLKMSDMGIGTCWLGRLGHSEIQQVIKLKEDYVGVISIAFGYPIDENELSLKLLEERNRKKVNQVVFGSLTPELNDIFEFVVAAPSAVNLQKTNYCIYKDHIHVYVDKSIIKALEANSFIDAGIALCHLCLICAEKGYKLVPFKEKEPSEIKGKTYIHSVKFIED